MSAARLITTERLIYLAQSILSLVPYEMPGLKTEGVTHDGIFLWDPDRWQLIELEDGVFGVAHETLHIVLDTHGRCEAIGADPALFNLASDFCINLLLRHAGFTPSPTDVFPEQFGLPDDMTAEQYYYELLKKNVPPSQHPGCGKGWCGSGGGRALPNEPEGQGSKDQDDQDPNAPKGKDGHGKPKDPNGGQDDNGPRGRSQADLDRMRQQTAQAMKDFYEAKGRGDCPAGIQRWIDEVTKPPKVRWETQLKHAARTSSAYRPGAVEYTWRRPSRRQGGLGWGDDTPILPGVHAPVPDVVLVVDTSGSMSANELGIIVREVNTIFRGMGVPKIRMLSCDAEVHGGIQEVRSWQDIAAKLHGGGGTDFRPAFREIQKMKPKPQLVIFGTDGDGTCPDKQPEGLRVIWLLTGAHARPPCSWGVQIRVED
jgi:predicted metal-dependent peptidase